jgi:hypothetical protein
MLLLYSFNFGIYFPNRRSWQRATLLLRFLLLQGSPSLKFDLNPVRILSIQYPLGKPGLYAVLCTSKVDLLTQNLLSSTLDQTLDQRLH